MTENTVVRTRIDEASKTEAAAVLATMGLSVSDAFRMLLKRVAADKALPFEPLTSNAETIEAMREARRGGLPRFKTVAALLADLNPRDRTHDAIAAVSPMRPVDRHAPWTGTSTILSINR